MLDREKPNLTAEQIHVAAERAHAVFARQPGWVYAGTGRPSVRDLEDTIRQLLGRYHEHGEHPVGDHRRYETGRIRLQVDHYEGDGGPDLAVYLRIADEYTRTAPIAPKGQS